MFVRMHLKSLHLVNTLAHDIRIASNCPGVCTKGSSSEDCKSSWRESANAEDTWDGAKNAEHRRKDLKCAVQKENYCNSFDRCKPASACAK